MFTLVLSMCPSFWNPMNFLLVSYLTMQYFQVGCVLEQPPHPIMNVSIQAELGNSEYYTGLTAPAKTQLYVIASNAYTQHALFDGAWAFSTHPLSQ